VSENTIELNGKRYDAVTGAYLGKSSAEVVLPALGLSKKRSQTIDGFIRPAHRDVHPTTIAKPTHKTATTHAQDHPKAKPRSVSGIVRAPGATHRKAHQPEHATTLMRTTVHKPKATPKPAIKAQKPAEVKIAARPTAVLAHKQSVSKVDPSRLERSQHVARHQAVRRFYATQPAALGVGNSTKTQHIPLPIIPVKNAPPHHASTSHREIHPKPADIFESAITHATSHKQPKQRYRKHHSRLVNTMAAVSAFVILGGFITYLNMPNIELHIASAQAGFHASLPGFRPTGYARSGHIVHAGGTISMRFTSGDSNYTITQQASDWNSQALLDNTLALSGAHQTVQKNGETIYIYNKGASAAWVNNGIRYDMSGNASLSSSDITSIATSL